MGVEFVEEQVRFVALHWVRCVALVGPLPIFGSGRDSRIARVGLGVMLGTILAFARGPAGFVDPGFTLLLAGCVVKEALLGLLFGFVATVTFSTMRVAGHLIGTEMGFNMANIQDPVTGVNTQLMAHFFEAMGLVAFFAVGGHHTIIRALAASFESQPVASVTLAPELFMDVITHATGIFAAGLQIAAPVFASMLVVGIAIAILSKVAPQLQVMMFAFPVKILAGLLLIASTLGSMAPAMRGLFENLETVLHDLTVF